MLLLEILLGGITQHIGVYNIIETKKWCYSGGYSSICSDYTTTVMWERGGSIITEIVVHVVVESEQMALKANVDSIELLPMERMATFLDNNWAGQCSRHNFLDYIKDLLFIL